jgi:hypothetical protein
LPAPQGVQSEAPVAEYLPAAQLVHSESLSDLSTTHHCIREFSQSPKLALYRTAKTKFESQHPATFPGATRHSPN